MILLYGLHERLLPFLSAFLDHHDVFDSTNMLWPGFESRPHGLDAAT